MVGGEGCLPCARIPGGRACILPHPQYYTQFNTALLLFMSSIVSPDSISHDTGPVTSSRALPETPGNSISPIRAPQDTPEILAWLNLPYDDVDDTPMPTSFITRRKLIDIIESTPDRCRISGTGCCNCRWASGSIQGLYIENLSSRRQSYRARSRREHEEAVQAAAAAVQVQQASQLQANKDQFDEEDYLTTMATLNFHGMPFDRITGLQAAIKRNCNCAKQVRKGVSEATEDFNRRCLAALQAWVVLPGEPQRICDGMLLKPQCGAVDANSDLGNPPFAECDFDKANLPHNILCRFYVENRTPAMCHNLKACGIFIDRKEIMQGSKDYYDYKAGCKNLWSFCEKDDDEDHH